MTQDSYAIGTAILQQRSLYLLLTKEEKQVRREALALLERVALSLSDKCFLFLYALEKMLGALDSPEVNRYFDGLELIGYPMEFIDKVSTGNSYPIAELSEYLDSHKYEIYQLRQEVQILRSIDYTLSQLLGLWSVFSFKPKLNPFPYPLSEEDKLEEERIANLQKEMSQWTDEQVTEIKAMDNGKFKVTTLKERLKAKLDENS